MHLSKMAAEGYWPQSQWLDKFFKFKSPTDPAFTVVAILDSVKGELKTRIFEAERDINANYDLASILNSHPRDMSTRIIVLAHDGYEHVDREVLNTISTAYSLDPLFLMSHFYWEDKSDRGNTSIQSERIHSVSAPISLPSFVNFLSLDYQGQFSGILLRDVSPQTGT